jgi:hypothetical protein
MAFLKRSLNSNAVAAILYEDAFINLTNTIESLVRDDSDVRCLH